jgi:leader peptidase (prepilin peptidase)/N-methyltransferase
VDFRLPPLILAPFIGSFLGVLILRLPTDRPFAWARSACETCGARLAPWDMVPILSYLLLRGHCRHCGAPIGAFHLHVELAAFLVPLSATFLATDPYWLWADCVFGWGLLALAWTDARTMLLPDTLTLPLLLLGLGATLWLTPEDIVDHALAAAMGVTAFVLIAGTYRRLRGIAGLGLGDAKLLGVAGAWLGLAALPLVVLVAALLGLGWAGLQAMRGVNIRRTSAIAFGPCLAAAIWIVRLLQSL